MASVIFAWQTLWPVLVLRGSCSVALLCSLFTPFAVAVCPRLRRLVSAAVFWVVLAHTKIHPSHPLQRLQDGIPRALVQAGVVSFEATRSHRSAPSSYSSTSAFNKWPGTAGYAILKRFASA